MTKPGNSDPADRPAEPATEPEETEPKDSAETGTDESPADSTAKSTDTEADSGADTGTGTGAAAKKEPEPVEPLMVELEKAPPPPEEPVMPTAAEAARRRSDLPRPKVLRIAFYLAIASAVVGLISALDLFLNKADLVESAQTIDTPKPLTAAEADRAVSSLLWLYLVVVIALGAFLVLFAYKAQDGVRRARMMAVIITLVLLIFHFYFFGTAFGQISGLFAAITLAMMFLPSTREYFGPRQQIR
ncbi:MAG: hypothetical protein ACRDSK_16405 [Actinophytocola sp.]|uniref:hypothetical protein n=1 Tax=Actinophytocola sp. TaxID=1872138 RepID=UPI003D6A3B09